MITIKKQSEIEILKDGGKILASILRHVAGRVNAGVTTSSLNTYAEELLAEHGVEGSFKGYAIPGVREAYPDALCVSVNDEIVHGIAGERVLKDGDIVSLDLGVLHKGLYTDSAITVPVGPISLEYQKIIATTKKALNLAIQTVRPGATIGDIGSVIQQCIESCGFTVVNGLVGHGVGYAVHEEPDVPNTGKAGTGIKLREGMVLAIEPMATTGAGGIKASENGWVWSTNDGEVSAHFEHTIAVTSGGAEVLTSS